MNWKQYLWRRFSTNYHERLRLHIHQVPDR
jgi:hypothetical protein